MKRDYLKLGIVFAVIISFYFMSYDRCSMDIPRNQICQVDTSYYILSRLLNSEADQKDTTDMRMIGSTVLNRLDNDSFPNTLESVINQFGQYSGVGSTQYKRSVLSDSIAAQLLRGEGRNCDVLYFFNYRLDAAPYFVNWLRRDRKLIFKNNHHEFYK